MSQNKIETTDKEIRALDGNQIDAVSGGALWIPVLIVVALADAGMLGLGLFGKK